MFRQMANDPYSFFFRRMMSVLFFFLPPDGPLGQYVALVNHMFLSRPVLLDPCCSSRCPVVIFVLSSVSVLRHCPFGYVVSRRTRLGAGLILRLKCRQPPNAPYVRHHNVFVAPTCVRLVDLICDSYGPIVFLVSPFLPAVSYQGCPLVFFVSGATVLNLFCLFSLGCHLGF